MILIRILVENIVTNPSDDSGILKEFLSELVDILMQYRVRQIAERPEKLQFSWPGPYRNLFGPLISKLSS